MGLMEGQALGTGEPWEVSEQRRGGVNTVRTEVPLGSPRGMEIGQEKVGVGVVGERSPE